VEDHREATDQDVADLLAAERGAELQEVFELRRAWWAAI
jgi:hypothetical protein